MARARYTSVPGREPGPSLGSSNFAPALLLTSCPRRPPITELAEVSGKFPGSPAMLSFMFTMSHGEIATLESGA